MSDSRSPLRLLTPIGRVLFGLIFLYFGPSMFNAGAVAKAASQGVPLAVVSVPLGGVLAIAGALSMISGFKVRVGAVLLALFLVPVTFYMHAFWAIPDPAAASLQRVMFLKNLSMLGAALVFAEQGARTLGLDAYLEARRSPRR